MPMSLLFWILYLISVIFGAWGSYDGQPLWYKRFGGYFVLWILVGLLGWQVFGAAVK